MADTSSDARFMLTRVVSGKQVGFFAVPGEVVAVERWTETQVSSASGSVHVHGNYTSVVPPKVWATSVGRKAVWIRTTADEIQVPVPEDLQIRQGHRVQAVASTDVGRGRSQWAAVVNHGTNRWMQIDRFPPSAVYDPLTSFVVGFGQGTGNMVMGIMLLYAVLFALIFAFSGRTLAAFGWGAFVGLAVGFIHVLVAHFQASEAADQYRAGVKAACDRMLVDLDGPTGG